MTDETSTAEQIEQATKQGWRDDPDHPQYKTAAKFIEDGEKIAPIAANNNKKLAKEVAELKGVIQGYGADIIKERHAGEVAGYQKKTKELEARKNAAFDNDDIDELKVINREEKNLKPPEPLKVEQPAQPQPNAEFTGWLPNNKWYTGRSPMDKAMQAYADEQIEDVKGTVDNDPDFYAEISKRVREAFPTQFGDTGGGDNGNGAAAVETRGRKAPKRNNGKQDWRSLPQDIRGEAVDNGIVDRYFKGDKEEYAKSYYTQFPE